ncbi:MAG: enoyl-CoA hydratase/isomerase family protein [Dehalococcoidia bacterium]
MAGETVLLQELDGGVALVTLNRSEALNAMNRALNVDLLARFQEIETMRSVRAVVLTGSGRAFSAGRDLKEYAATPPSPVADWQQRTRSAFFSAVTGCGVPVIAAVNGYCLAGGCELALACDLRVAGEGAVFGLPEIDHGIWPGAGATYRLPTLVGMGLAMELLLTGARIDARRAAQIGLVNRVVADDQVVAEALTLARVIASKSATAVRLMRAAVRLGRSLDEQSAVVATGALRALVETTEERRAGPRAFAERHGG